MQKLSYAVLQKLIKKNVTSAEIDVLLYVSRFQNDKGTAEGMYYKAICQDLDIAYQTFYDAKESLVKKGIISVQKNHYLDHDITILDNDFTDSETYKKGYINTNHELFACVQFRMMKAGAKLLAMDLMKNNLASDRSYHKDTQKFMKDNIERFHICKRTLQQYLKELRLLFHIGVKDKKYWITIRAFAKKRQAKNETTRYRENSIDVAIRRSRIPKQKVRREDVKELKKLLSQYHSLIKESERFSGENFSFASIVERSMEVLNPGIGKNKWKRRLKPTLIHRLLRVELGLEVKNLPYSPATV